MNEKLIEEALNYYDGTQDGGYYGMILSQALIACRATLSETRKELRYLQAHAYKNMQPCQCAPRHRERGELNMELKEKTVWNGDYKGVSFEIQKWPGFEYKSIRSNKWNWTMYLYLILERIPEDADSYWLGPREEYARIHYDYYSHPIISAIEFHGGITWYSKEAGFDGNKQAIKIGCDFQHSWDMEHGDYSLDTVIYAAKQAIDSFRDLVPGYKYWCRQDGKLHNPSEVELFPDGAYACRCGKEVAIKSEAQP